MPNTERANQGIRLLVQKCRNEFRSAENINFYAETDFKEAERKFVKFCLLGHSDAHS